MRTLILFLLFLFPCSCSTLNDFTYQMELHRFVRNFEEDCNCKVTVPIKIVAVPSDKDGYKTLGVCYGFRMPSIFRSIEIDKDYWATASYYEKESTIYHELAHCQLDLEHTDEWVGDYVLFGRPKSIMYPYSFPQYEVFRDEYIKELFSRKPGPWKF